MKRTLLAPLAVALLLPGCGAVRASGAGEPIPALGREVAVSGGSYRELDVAQLQAFLSAGAPRVINVHIPFEGDLPGTDDSIAYNEIANHLSRLPADRGAAIVLYCRSGRMSAIAAEMLVGLGYTRVYHLGGGFNAWRSAGLPMAQ
jgi:rhodanese-related sulfurtransferase